MSPLNTVNTNASVINISLSFRYVHSIYFYISIVVLMVNHLKYSQHPAESRVYHHYNSRGYGVWALIVSISKQDETTTRKIVIRILSPRACTCYTHRVINQKRAFQKLTILRCYNNNMNPNNNWWDWTMLKIGREQCWVNNGIQRLGIKL